MKKYKARAKIKQFFLGTNITVRTAAAKKTSFKAQFNTDIVC